MIGLRAAVAELYDEHGRRFPRLGIDPETTYAVETCRALFSVREILREPLLRDVMFRSVTDAGRRAEAQAWRMPK